MGRKRRRKQAGGNHEGNYLNSNHAALSLVKTKAALKDSLVIWILLTVYNLLTLFFIFFLEIHWSQLLD